ncbi:MAG: hypothetical protein QM482_05480 [Sulfurospirillum sp.]
MELVRFLFCTILLCWLWKSLKKGIIYAIIGAFPLFGLIIGIIAGKNARKDLLIGKQDFKWANVALTVFLTIASGFTMKTLINGGTSFKYQAFEINGVPQNQLIAGALLKKMRENAK